MYTIKGILSEFNWAKYNKLSKNAREAAKKYTPAKRNEDLQDILMA